MRSPYPTPGRNTLLERIWQLATSFSRAPVEGRQRPLSAYFTDDNSIWGRKYDLEISEVPVRDAVFGYLYLEMIEHCPLIAAAIQNWTLDCWASIDGDDQGFAVAPTLNDNETPIDPEVERILNRLIDEVIGGTSLEPCVERILGRGDGNAFLSIGINPRQRRIERILFLPSWELFRVETNKGELLAFEQRRHISDNDPITFHPLTCVHWRYRRLNLYGRGLFHESVYWDYLPLKEARKDLMAATRATAVNPRVHQMPDCTDESYRQEYIERYEARKAKGPITDFYLMPSGKVDQLSSTNPDLKGLLDICKYYEEGLARRSLLPAWRLLIDYAGAKDIASQPALASARFVNNLRQHVTAGIKHLCNLELALHGYPKEKWQYRIVWPKIFVNEYEQQLNPEAVAEMNASTVEDLDRYLPTPEKDWLSLASEQEIAKAIDANIGVLT